MEKKIAMAMKKIAISLPEPVLERVDRLAASRGESRSRLIATVLDRVARAKRDRDITAQIDALLANGTIAAEQKTTANEFLRMSRGPEGSGNSPMLMQSQATLFPHYDRRGNNCLEITKETIYDPFGREPMKKTKMSLAQIRAKYKDEWVLLAYYDLDERNEPLSGVVVAHSKDREEIYNRQMGIKKALCILYTGELPRDLAIMF